MTPSGEYEMMEKAGSLFIQWTGPTVPIEFTFISLVLLATLPFLFYFRGGVARFADRHLHVHWSPLAFGIAAPLLSLACGTFLLFTNLPPRLSILDLGRDGVSVKTSNGQSQINWDEITSATFDSLSTKSDNTTLVLKSKDSHALWLPLSWFPLDHQEKILAFINTATGNRFHLPERLEDSPAPPPDSISVRGP